MTDLVFINRFFYPDNSATSQILSEVCFALVQRGYRVSVVTSRQHYSRDWEQQPLKRTESIRGVDIIRLPSIGQTRKGLFSRIVDYLVFLILAACFLVFRLRRGTIVIAKTDPPMLGVFLWPFIRMRGAALVNWFQDLFPEILLQTSLHDTTGWYSRALLRIRDWNCRCASLNVTLSGPMAEYLEDRGIPRQKIEVIPNFALSGLKPISRCENTVRNMLSLSDKFVVGYSGNLGRAHDWKTILGAVETLSSNQDVHFLFFGGGVGMSALRAEAERLSLQNIEFRSYQSPELLSQSLSAIDVHLVSIRPGLANFIFPSKVYGIMAVRRPMILIGSKEDMISHYVQTAGCGLAVNVGDVNALCSYVLQLKKDGSLYSELSDNGFREFQNRYNVNSVALQWGRALEPLYKR